MEEQVLSIYTLPIFRRFQIELNKFTSYNIQQINPSLFEVSPIRNAVFGYGARNYRITANLEQDEYSCECCKFTRDGLICCHIIKVMSAVGKVEVMPEHYILPRWSIPPPDIRIPQTEPQQMPAGKLSRKEMRLLRYGNLTKDFAKLVVNSYASEKTDEVARKHMRAIEAEFVAMKKQAADALKRKKKQKETVPPCVEHAETTENPSSSTVGAEHNMHVNKKARDPPLTVTKGRPEEKRKKSGLHLKPAKPTKCTICGSTLHNPKDCPSKIAMKEKTPIIQLFQ
ncbi:protein FAR-RED ELONGATED HYPOCOTYL 3-like [Lolium perenne]|uniref:protein FAR-RED ELONGATED HYPOCOTYL 3-like n=1 Tax=Lolium perenne TaxID=4522 RepID=UPI0021F4FEF2|nr:uncharacterized protein LOC127328669 [Lolium perenne]